MLFELRDYLENKGAVNLQQLAIHFQQSPDTVRCWLQHWMRKGQVCRLASPAGCGSKCQLCRPEHAEVYQWSK